MGGVLGGAIVVVAISISVAKFLNLRRRRRRAVVAGNSASQPISNAMATAQPSSEPPQVMRVYV